MLAEITPQGVSETLGAAVAAAFAETLGGINRLVDRSDHLTDRDSIRGQTEAITTARTTHTAHQTMLAQAGKQLLEIGQGDALALRRSARGTGPALHATPRRAWQSQRNVLLRSVSYALPSCEPINMGTWSHTRLKQSSIWLSNTVGFNPAALASGLRSECRAKY